MRAVTTRHAITAMSPVSIEKVRQLEAFLLSGQGPQLVTFETKHLLHAGMYARTIRIPKDGVITGALVKVATSLVINGHVTVYTDAGSVEFIGYNVIPASAGTKRAFYAHNETDLTMVLATSAESIEEAEIEFTNESSLLASRVEGSLNTIIITGE